MKPFLALFLSAAGLSAQGCALVPQSGALELEHISHPLVGYPLTEARDASGVGVEDGLSQLNLVAHWQLSPRLSIENALGWNLQGTNGGGFYGPSLTYSGRIRVALWGSTK